MRKQGRQDVLLSVAAVIADALAVLSGFIAATYIRFDSALSASIPVTRGRPEALYSLYMEGAAIAVVLYLFILRGQGMYVRPQTGSFLNKIPRLIKATAMGTMLTVVLAFAVKNDADFSRLVIGLSFFTIAFMLIFERYILFRAEWNLARHSLVKTRVLILGADAVGAHIARSIDREPLLRSKVIGFLRFGGEKDDESIASAMILGGMDQLDSLMEAKKADRIILSGSGLGHEKVVDLIMKCEQNLVEFNMVPDLFRILTSSMDVQSINDIPLLGIGKWPLDYFWNRAMKRIEDLVGSLICLLLALPVIAVAIACVKRESPGPGLYGQKRCGEDGHEFTIYKIRTMRVDAEQETGPVWAVENDDRCTRVGAFLRRHNLDELPQLWNVLMGDMSLIGPRPERPQFVEKFKEDINHYMWRHVSKPGMTGWAQINGLRGNTSIEERVKYDLYYLENWSLAFDFKILLRTFLATKNAY
jgi:exopolysaccharide biosynthesis polyprenyl glycosylphosphotransferase